MTRKITEDKICSFQFEAEHSGKDVYFCCFSHRICDEEICPILKLNMIVVDEQ